MWKRVAGWIAGAGGFAVLAGCAPQPPGCDVPEATILLKQLAVGREGPVPPGDRLRIDRFLTVSDVSGEGVFGAREHCSATLAMSDAATAILRNTADPDVNDPDAGPMRVQYDIVLPLDQSVVSVLVVEAKDLSPPRVQRFASALAQMPESFGADGASAAP